ncbi:MAG: hypothetical protein ACR2M0_14015 [Chloroflexia bacterium]
MIFSLLPVAGRILIGLSAIHASQPATPTATTAFTVTTTTGITATTRPVTATVALTSTGLPTTLTATTTTGITATTSPFTLTGTLSPTLVPPTAAPAPVIPAPTTSVGDYLGQAAQSDLGDLSIAFLIVSIIMLGVGAYFYFVGKRRWHRVHKLNYRLANFWSLTAMLLGAVGVVFVLLRMLHVDGLNARIWLYLVLLVWLGFGIYAAYYFRARYPQELARYNKTLKPRGAARSGARPARPTGAAAPTPERPGGTAGNPRGSSPRGERRREKK